MLVTRDPPSFVTSSMTAVRTMDSSGVRSDAVDGIDALYRLEARALVGMLTAYVGDRALAEDLAQEAFARVHATWDRIREPERTVSYLRATAFNLARSALRRRVRPIPTLEIGVVGTPEDGLLLREDQREVLASVQRLPRQQRACVILRYYAELGVDDIATTLGISPNSVKTHLVRALDALESSLGGQR
jgi:RNA polymerase sigma factor (sigma-70 family)